MFLGVVGVLLAGFLVFRLYKWFRWVSAGNIPTPTKFPENLPLLGAVVTLAMRLDTLNDWLYEMTTQLGETWSFWAPGQPRFIVITNPVDVEHMLRGNFDNYVKGPEFHERFVELLGDGIFNADGENWYQQRKTASALFKVRNFRDNMAEVFRRHGEKLHQVLAHKADSGEPVDLHNYFHRFTLDSIGQIGFGVDLDSVSAHNNEFAHAFDGSQEAVNYRFFSPIWYLRKFFAPQEFALRSAIKYLNRFTYQIVDARLADPDSCAANFDLLSIFLQRGLAAGKMPSRQFLRDLVINFIIAGRDTTAQGLSWMFYELLTHPEEMKKVVAEIDHVLAGEPPSFDRIKQLDYLTATFSETLRLHPSVPKDAKMALRDDTLPSSGYRVPAGTWLCYPPYVMGRLPALWGEDCLEFKPERFIQDPKPSPFKFTAFQAGPRVCLGQDMAYLEARFVACFLLQNFEFSLAPNSPPVTYLPSLTLQMRNGLWCNVKKRN